MMQDRIRNFAIIAHVDHGKSTLADRMLEITGIIRKEDLEEQFLDSNPISRERGITIKLAPVRMDWNGYVLDLIDTPGHVDFSYEVHRTLAACEGAVLLVDATKGIQAQTVAHYNHAKKLGLTFVPVINKIDLPNADTDRVKGEMMMTFGFEDNQILLISAKTGEGVENLLAEIVAKIPPPTGSSTSQTQALIFDSVYDEHRGIVIYVRLRNGEIKKGDELLFINDKTKTIVNDVGFMKPGFVSADKLTSGEVGYVITSVKDITQAKVGDTITQASNPGVALPGYTPAKPFVFLSIYPSSTADFQNLRRALHKLKLNDAALEFVPEQSVIFGPGFRCGFLGLLHAQIVIERIEKEDNIDIFAAPPSIQYIIDGQLISRPQDFDIAKKDVQEPYILGEIFTPGQYLGSILELIHSRRGIQDDIVYFGTQVRVVFRMPLANTIYDFYDKLKSSSSGFASFDYEFADFRISELTRVDISVNDEAIPEFSFVVHKTEIESFSRRIVNLLVESIPKHNFVINVRASVGSGIIASEKIGALHKDVLAKMSGGDRTRKDKLLEAQKKGKKKMKQIGRVSVPKEAFMSILKAY